MNKVYGIVWSQALGMWMAVSEHTVRRGKSAGSGGTALGCGLAFRRLGLNPLGLAVALGLSGAAGLVQGADLPVLESDLDHANTTITTTGTTMDIVQTAEKVVINWNSFDIAAGYTVAFNQPDSSSIALNRVTGSDGSNILGTLTANGQIFLINPNGILFGEGAQVSVGSLVASTLSISDQDFDQGAYTFNGGSTVSSTINKGNITAAEGGSVVLLGGQVSNEGVIVAQQGSVALAAGESITLSFDGTGLLNVAVDSALADALVENKQLIQADGGSVILTAYAADALLNTVVNNTGIIQAQSVGTKNGTIVLDGKDSGVVQVAGKLDASAQVNADDTSVDGGNIEVLGQYVRVLDSGVQADGETQKTDISTLASNGGTTGTMYVELGTDFSVGSEPAAATSGISASTLSGIQDASNFYVQTSGDLHLTGAIEWSADTTLTMSATQKLYQDSESSITVSGEQARAYLQSSDMTLDGDITVSGEQATLTLAGALGGDLNLNGSGTLVVSGEQAKIDLTADGNTNINHGIELSGESAVLSIFYGGCLESGCVAAENTDYQIGTDASFTFSGSQVGLNINGTSYELIRSVSELENITNLSGHYALAQDLTLDSVYSEALIADSSNPFSGTFAGLGNSIDGLTIEASQSDYVGLFAYVEGASIRDLGLTNVSVTGEDYVGGLVGYSSNSSLSEVYATGSVTGVYDVGGLVGYSSNSSLSEVYATGSVTGEYEVGGLVGYSYKSSLSEVYATGAVTGVEDVGGLVGESYESSLSEGYATGAVTGEYEVGGLVGYSLSSSLSEVYATGAVTGEYSVGGLVGYSYGISLSEGYATGAVTGTGYVGGLVGYSDNSSLSEGYATGAVTGEYSVGGLVGESYGSSLSEGYATGAVTGEYSVGGLVGYSDSGSLSEVYATGAVTGESDVGGLVGVSYLDSLSEGYATGAVTGTEYVGGLVGYSYYSNLSEAYAMGAVTGTEYVGGLVGQVVAGSISNTYSIGMVTGVEGSTYLGGLIGADESAYGGEPSTVISGSFYASTDAYGNSINNGGVVANGYTGNSLGTAKRYAELTTLDTYTDAGWDIVSASGQDTVWYLPSAATPLLNNVYAYLAPQAETPSSSDWELLRLQPGYQSALMPPPPSVNDGTQNSATSGASTSEPGPVSAEIAELGDDRPPQSPLARASVNVRGLAQYLKLSIVEQGIRLPEAF
jgi:filamentous hemagglutinin family protein